MPQRSEPSDGVAADTDVPSVIEEVYGDHARREVVDLIPSSASSVLDVGCYRGAFGATIRTEGRTIWGIEPNAAAAELAATRLDRVIVGHFPDDVPIDATFDCIVFNDVLEHMVDPWSAVRASLRWLNPGGAVVASIPNVRHISVIYPLVRRGVWNYQENGLLDRTHLRFFTKSSMRALFEESGLRVESIAPITRLHPNRRNLIGRAVQLLGKRSEELMTIQYGVVARAAHA